MVVSFLSDLFDRALKEDTDSYVVFQKNVRTWSPYWIRNFDNVTKYLDENNNQGKPTYFSLLTHRSYEVEKEGKADVYRKASSASQLVCLFVDVDTNYKRESKERYPSDQNEALKYISHLVKERMIYNPSYIIDSGRGLHLYYLLENPFVATEESKDELKSYLQLWRDNWVELFKLNDWDIDTSIFEPARIFRLPESVNEKSDSIVSVLFPEGYEDGTEATRYDLIDLVSKSLMIIDKHGKKEKTVLSKSESSQTKYPEIIDFSLDIMKRCPPTSILNSFESYFRFAMGAKAAGLSFDDIEPVLEKHQDRFSSDELKKNNEEHWNTLKPESITAATFVSFAKQIAPDLWKERKEKKEKKEELTEEQLIGKYGSKVKDFFLIPSQTDECHFRSKGDPNFYLDLNKTSGFRSFCNATELPIDDKEIRKAFNVVNANQYKNVNGIINIYEEKHIYFKGFWRGDRFYVSIPADEGHIYDPLPNIELEQDYLGLLSESTTLDKNRMLSFMMANELVIRNRSWPDIFYEPLLFIFQDSGNTGKSNAMQAVFLIADTRESNQLTSSDFTWENTLTFKACSDQKGGILINEPQTEDYDFCKAITGNPTDVYAAKVKYRKTAVYIQACNIFITSNKLHLANVNEDAIRRRLINARTDPTRFQKSLRKGTAIAVVAKYYNELRVQVIQETIGFLQHFYKKLDSNREKIIRYRDIELYLDLIPYQTLMDTDNEDRYSWEVDDFCKYINTNFGYKHTIFELETRDESLRKILNIPETKKVQPFCIKFVRGNKALIEEKANVCIDDFSNNAKKIKFTSALDYCKQAKEDNVLDFNPFEEGEINEL